MREATEQDREKILQYLSKELANCIYLYIDIMNYGIATENLKVWMEEKQGDPSLVVMKYYDSFQIYSRDKTCDTEPVAALLREHPVKMISGSKVMIESLEKKCTNYRATYGAVFVMDRFHRVEAADEVLQASENDAGEIAELICSDGEIGGHYTVDGLRRQLIERIRTKTGRSYIIRSGGRIVAHTATYAEADKIAVVSGTMIHPDYRDTNYYLLLSNYMLQQMEKEQKKVYTFAVSEKMIRYHRAVHTECGTYGKLELGN